MAKDNHAKKPRQKQKASPAVTEEARQNHNSKKEGLGPNTDR